jgi:hypothetical protein
MGAIEEKPTPGGVYGHNSGNLEIPFQLGCCKWGDETTGGSVYMDPG